MAEVKKKEEHMYCIKCNRTVLERNFYKLRNQAARYNVCKQCLTMHVNNFEPDSFMWILKELDYPYVPVTWNQIRDKIFAENPNKMAGSTVLGKYISKMKLVQWKDYGWADSQELQQRQLEKVQKAAIDKQISDNATSYIGMSEQELRKKAEDGEISIAEYRAYAPVEDQYKAFVAGEAPQEKHLVNDSPFQKAIYADIEIPDPTKELTDDDILYLLMKWGKTYKPEEWIELEKMYTEIENSCQALDPDTKNTLVLICKTSLKANQSLDIGDIDSFQKLSRVLDTLRKSANLTAVQKKKDQLAGAASMTSIGQLVAYLEKNGGAIPRFQITAPVDIIDKVIQDQKDYVKNLVYRDTALAKQIQDYIKRKESVAASLQREEERQAGLYDEITNEDLSDYAMTEQELAAATAEAIAYEGDIEDELAETT